MTNSNNRGNSNTFLKQVLIGIIIVVSSTFLMGGYSMSVDVEKNTQHRLSSVDVEKDISVIRQDLCWIKGYIRGEDAPKCN